MKQLLQIFGFAVAMLTASLASAQTTATFSIVEQDSLETAAPGSVRSPWRYSNDSTDLFRYVGSSWVPLFDTLYSRNDSLFYVKFGTERFAAEISASGGVSDGDKGDITVASSGTSWTIDNSTIGSGNIINGAVGWADLSSAVQDSIQAGGGGISDGDKGDITVASSGASMTINAGAVDTDELAADAVTAAKIEDDAVTSDHIATLTADLDAGSNKITNVTDPTSDQDAATKAYVDGQIASVETFLDTLYFLGTGQSNMDRVGTETGGETSLNTSVQNWNKSTDSWETADFSTWNNPLWQFAKRYQDKNPRSLVRIFHIAEGGQSISQWYADSTLYDTIRSELTAAGSPQLSGILWHQGESDRDNAGINAVATGTTADDNYKTALSTVIEGFRSESWFDDHTPFVVGGLVLADMVVNPRDARNEALRYQNYDTDAWTSFARSEGLGSYDSIHFNATAIDTLGKRYLAAFEATPYLYEQADTTGLGGGGGGGSSLWTQSGSNIYYSTGGVSIGTSTALNDFYVYDGSGNANIMAHSNTASGVLHASGANGFDAKILFQEGAGTTTNYAFGVDGSDSEVMKLDTDAAFTTTPLMAWNKSNSRVGIGTNAPGQRLHVAGGSVRIDDGSLTGINLSNVGSGSNNDLQLQSAASNSRTMLNIVPNGTNTAAFANTRNSSDASNYGVARMGVRGAYALSGYDNVGTPTTSVQYYAVELDPNNAVSGEAFIVGVNGFFHSGSPTELLRVESAAVEMNSNSIELGNGVKVLSGSGTPEGSVTAPVGSMYLRSDGGTGTTLYIKESGTGNTGWVAK